MQIQKFGIRKLRNEEWFRFHTEFSELAVLCGLIILGLERLYPPFEALYKEADELLERLRKSFITINTTEANQQREQQYRGLRESVKTFLYSLDANVKAAAAKLNDVIGKYHATIMRGGRSAATAAIDNLLQDLTSTPGGMDFSQEVHLLGVETWVNSLTAANQTYKEAMAQRIEESTRRPDTGRLKQVRLEMDFLYLSMTSAVNARLAAIGNIPEEEEEEEEPSGPVEDRNLPDTDDGKVIHFAKGLNFCIAHYKAILKGRHTRSEKKTDESQDDYKV
ncbi:MAG: DUF6261 family protein [Tannerellaceae bacterium]|nr:DUF6261 family protein [Tannerellaceae bacterium]